MPPTHAPNFLLFSTLHFLCSLFFPRVLLYPPIFGHRGSIFSLSHFRPSQLVHGAGSDNSNNVDGRHNICTLVIVLQIAARGLSVLIALWREEKEHLIAAAAAAAAAAAPLD